MLPSTAQGMGCAVRQIHPKLDAETAALPGQQLNETGGHFGKFSDWEGGTALEFNASYCLSEIFSARRCGNLPLRALPMGTAPMLSAAQYRKIEADLPPKRRDRAVISALLYRASSGQSLRDVAEAYGISRARLSEWERLLESVLPQLMQKLGLDAASSRSWRGGGQAWTRRTTIYADVTALRLANFGRALRRAR